MDPINGTIYAGELERLEADLFRADWDEAKVRLGRDPELRELERTGDQRRADAMVLMAQRSASLPTASTGARPSFEVVLGGEGFAHLCELATGQVVPPSALVGWLDEATVQAILFEPGTTHAVKASSQRLFTGILRRVLNARDRTCFHLTCDESAGGCQGDHTNPWSQGGPTSQENGRLACGFHNRSRHGRGPPPTPRD
jgi:hypothetical protein